MKNNFKLIKNHSFSHSPNKRSSIDTKRRIGRKYYETFNSGKNSYTIFRFKTQQSIKNM